MDNNDKVRFGQIMAGLAEDCSAMVSTPGLMMRFEALKQYSLEQVEAAVMSIIRSNIYTKMPPTGAIIRAIEGTDDDRSERQIQVIRDEIRRIGSYGSPVFEDPVTADLVSRRFSWGAICAMPERGFAFFASSFKSAYSTQSKDNALRLGCGGVAGLVPIALPDRHLLGGAH